MSTARDGIRLAVGTLTAVPVRPPGAVDRRVAGVAMVLAPLAVLPVALGAALVLWGALRLGAPPLAASTLAVAALALGTRGLHLDGLADTVDGLACTGGRDRALEVMRRGDVGPAGAAALLLVVLVQVASLAATRHAALILLLATVTSRVALAVACSTRIPSARPDGLGAAAARTVPTTLAAGIVVVVGVAYSVMLGPAGMVAVGLAALAAAGVLVACVRRLGGVTGDVLGAVVEAVTAAFLLALASIL